MGEGFTQSRFYREAKAELDAKLKRLVDGG
jgi:hypothetical protein